MSCRLKNQVCIIHCTFADYDETPEWAARTGCVVHYLFFMQLFMSFMFPVLKSLWVEPVCKCEQCYKTYREETAILSVAFKKVKVLLDSYLYKAEPFERSRGGMILHIAEAVFHSSVKSRQVGEQEERGGGGGNILRQM